jgi:malonyl-CoA decarboxylase
MEPSKPSDKKIRQALELLKSIQVQKEASRESMVKFQDLFRSFLLEEHPLFFEAVIREFEINQKDIEKDLELVLADEGKDSLQWQQGLKNLRQKIESPRIRIFRNFLNFSGGLKFLLDLRADVIAAQRQFPVNLEPLDLDIAQLFDLWFQGGFLFLNEITLDSPYRQIRFLKEHDLVHPIASLEEMGSRLGADRRCFALYHHLMPDEPITFIEVALSRGMVTSIHKIIENQENHLHNKKTPDTAIFYSINNTQNGLTGLGLGKVLIFQVVETLEKNYPGIKTFATLSPIPGFWDRYFQPILKGENHAFQMNRDRLTDLFPEKIRQSLLEIHSTKSGKQVVDLSSTLLEILSNPRWIENPDYLRILKKPLPDLVYFYLTQEKDRRGKPLNPVANFHLGNGATVGLKNINFAANHFPRGLMESCGMMVNYIYSQTWLQQVRQTMKGYLPWKK